MTEVVHDAQCSAATVPQRPQPVCAMKFYWGEWDNRESRVLIEAEGDEEPVVPLHAKRPAKMEAEDEPLPRVSETRFRPKISLWCSVTNSTAFLSLNSGRRAFRSHW